MRTAQSKTATKASTVHTSPFKPNGEETLQDSSLPQRRKCVKYVQSHQSTDAEHISTVVQSMAPTAKFPYSSAIPRRPKQQLPEARTKEIMYKIASANCASTKDKSTRRNSSKSSRRLTHDEGPVQAFTQAARLLGPSLEVSTNHLETASTHQLHPRRNPPAEPPAWMK